MTDEPDDRCEKCGNLISCDVCQKAAMPRSVPASLQTMGDKEFIAEAVLAAHDYIAGHEPETIPMVIEALVKLDGKLILTEDEFGEKVQLYVDGELAHIEILLENDPPPYPDDDSALAEAFEAGRKSAIDVIQQHKAGHYADLIKAVERQEAAIASTFTEGTNFDLDSVTDPLANEVVTLRYVLKLLRGEDPTTPFKPRHDSHYAKALEKIKRKREEHIARIPRFMTSEHEWDNQQAQALSWVLEILGEKS